jgi:tetratricopeptide (TPR) repeat protein
LSEALKTWRNKLDHLQQQEAIVADPAQRFALAEQIKEAKAKVADLQAASVNQPTRGSAAVPIDISRIVKYAPTKLIGRESETQLLNDAWARVQNQEPKRPHVLTFVALGGEGKTSLVAKWAADLAHQGWRGCEAVFAWSFYSQGTREQVAASSDLFLKEALIFFGDDADKEFAASPAGAFEKGQRLARIVGQRRSLLILDGLEPLQYPTEAKAFKPGELKDQGIAKLLKDLASTNFGLCIVTTRIEMPDLNAFKGGVVIETHLKRLPRAAGVSLLKSLGVKGSERRDLPLKASDPNGEKVNEFEKLVEDVKAHALTLTLLGGFLKRAFHGDIRQRDRVKFEKADERMDGGHAFRTMAAYEEWLLRDGGDEGRREVAVLRLMGLFDRPADAGCLAALRSETIPGLTEPLAGLAEDDWEYCLSGLETAKLLTVNRDASGALVSLDAHPHLREYFAHQLRRQQPDAWRAAHRRVYEHLCLTTPDRDEPTLEDLQPLYQAVAHGCQAGLQQEACDAVYYARIVRKNENYTIHKLGALGSDLGVIACFFEALWSRVSPALSEADQAWLMNEAAYRLRALGRLTEAIEPMRSGIDAALRLEDWNNASRYSSNLSETELAQGDVARAVADAERSVTYADRSSDAFVRMASRPRVGNALYQAGDLAEAEKHFQEAEALLAEQQPDYALLYSDVGFQYCDLLLAGAERAAWQTCVAADCSRKVTLGNSPRVGHEEVISGLPNAIRAPSESCRAVSQRATVIQKRRTGLTTYSLLDKALDNLTLGRTALYETILEVGTAFALLQFASDSPATGDDVEHRSRLTAALNSTATKLNTAVDGFRRSGNIDELPRGLLTRAWQRFLTHARNGIESAQADLDEAWEIAERGPMRLFMADIHLYRARLFHHVKPYPWTSPQDDLASAEKLINECGYHRRDEELADAKLAILGG